MRPVKRRMTLSRCAQRGEFLRPRNCKPGCEGRWLFQQALKTGAADEPSQMASVACDPSFPPILLLT